MVFYQILYYIPYNCKVYSFAHFVEVAINYYQSTSKRQQSYHQRECLCGENPLLSKSNSAYVIVSEPVHDILHRKSPYLDLLEISEVPLFQTLLSWIFIFVSHKLVQCSHSQRYVAHLLSLIIYFLFSNSRTKDSLKALLFLLARRRKCCLILITFILCIYILIYQFSYCSYISLSFSSNICEFHTFTFKHIFKLLINCFPSQPNYLICCYSIIFREKVFWTPGINLIS